MTVTTETIRKPHSACSAPADEELLRRYRRHGDRRAFEQLVRRYEGELYSYLRRYLSDAAMAEDAFQATFLQVHLKCDQFDEARPFRPWLYTIATNQAIDAGRRNKRHRMVSLDRQNRRGTSDAGSLLEMSASEGPGPVAALESSERRDLVRQAVADLPETLKSAVMLIYYQGLKYREAADVLDIPVGTVKSRLHAAVNKLNEILQRSQLSESVHPDA
jgi:RNA polymerase sigma-70 factor (ECF subfamily)